jgi:hypothetical protein
VSLHPELQRIEQQYFALAEDLRLGNISESDALAVMGNLRAVDGEGALWSIDPYSGDFVRAVPGGPAYPTDPARFAPAQLPPVDLQVLPHGSHPSMVSEFQHPALRPLPPEPRSAKVKTSIAGSASALFSGLGKMLGPVGSLLSKHLRTVLMVLAFVTIAFVMISRSPSKEDNSPDEAAPQVTVPVSVPDILLPGEEPAPAPVSKTDVDALIGVLATGDAEALAEILPEKSAASALAPLLGAARLGLALTAGYPVAATDGTTTVAVTVGDPAAPTETWELRISPEGTVLGGARK